MATTDVPRVMETREHYELLARHYIMLCMTRLGLSPRWRWRFRFVRNHDDQNVIAQIDGSTYHMEVDITFDERLRPEYYESEAFHECLHILLASLEKAVESLQEPGKTMLEELIHTAINQLVYAFTNKRGWREEMRGDRAPWEK